MVEYEITVKIRGSADSAQKAIDDLKSRLISTACFKAENFEIMWITKM